MPLPALLDVAVDRDEAGDVIVELIFEDRRIGFVHETRFGRVAWYIASQPPHARDGAGSLNAFITSRMIISRGFST